ncbi:hypothetical protein [Pedobacter sp.]|uniref:hypothetical protein n=1 Tax=Pedobacter sp. TaxID=1411316 RepID=UPI002C4E4C20|nr:hypothetical protein [Pedobacter sp.]HWW41537.1 hypothetical protein [Pedobacter sp.]
MNAQSVKVKEFVYNLTYKNIAAYNIKYASFSNNGIYFDNQLKSSSDFFFDKLLPDGGSKMDLDIEAVKELFYPLSNYLLFSVSTKGLRFYNQATGMSRVFKGPHIGRKYLVAVDTLTSEIKFLSGLFFNNLIVKDFNLYPDIPDSYLQFLKIKGFQWSIDDIKFSRKKSGKLYFNCYSELYHKNATVILDLKKPEFLVLSD